jgi:hypothetical protein
MLREAFADIWAADATLWRRLLESQQTHTALARLWLTSPGRRLVQELDILKRAPAPAPLGASDFSWDSLCAAAGPLPDEPLWQTPAFDQWRELHAAIPGSVLSRWKPADEDDASAVMRILEGRRGDPVLLRGAALAWLLNRAATDPFYSLDGQRRDLRVDLPPALVSAFPEPEDSRYAELRAAARLETAALQLAARLVIGKPDEEALPRAWSFARWIQSCAFRSPFFGGDEAALAARLRVLLPEDPLQVPIREDVLDPNRLRDEGAGLAIEELALIAGLVEHYEPGNGEAHPVLLPTPTPLVNSLRRLARRQLRPEELEAEVLLARLGVGQDAVSHLSSPESPLPAAEPHSRALRARRGNVLGWKGPHIAPPLAARWLMTLRNIPWLAEAPEPIWLESLQRLEQEPARHVWIAFALYREREALSEALRDRAAAAWRHVCADTQGQLGQEGALALMAVSVLDQLSESEERELVAIAEASVPSWRHYNLEALALAADRHQRPVLFSEALEALLDMMSDATLPTDERLRAALITLRRTSSLPVARPERVAFLMRLVAATSGPPFNQYVELRRELRRLGLLPHSQPGGGR